MPEYLVLTIAAAAIFGIGYWIGSASMKAHVQEIARSLWDSETELVRRGDVIAKLEAEVQTLVADLTARGVL